MQLKMTLISISRVPVPTVLATEHISEIAKIMINQNVGAVVVTRDYEPLGIITEKDILKRMLLANKGLNEAVAQEIMTSPLLTIDSSRGIEEALEIMQKNRVRRLVVVKGKKLVGILTERRLLLARNSLVNARTRLAQ